MLLAIFFVGVRCAAGRLGDLLAGEILEIVLTSIDIGCGIMAHVRVRGSIWVL